LQREIILTQRLTEGFKLAQIKVTPKEEEEETELVESLAPVRVAQEKGDATT
jgi:hypothetical protein